MRKRFGALCALFVALTLIWGPCSLPASASGESFTYALGGGNTSQFFAIGGDSQCTVATDLSSHVLGGYVTPLISTNSGSTYTPVIAPLTVPATALATSYLDNAGQALTFNATNATNVQIQVVGGQGVGSSITGTLTCSTTNAPVIFGGTTTNTNTAQPAGFHYVAGYCASAATCTVNFTTNWTSSTTYECVVTSEVAADAPYLSTKTAAQIVITGSGSAARDWICAGS